ncbi:jun dimerization protein 2 [Platysternon megacephalum]|uniref:Jun dimerization protein 2 n=1 Tax=Platysternon megacephalum TaxID=55544 RepID=A0A4D9EUN1_9SAUR|nr:jun dimerization protein 2 [Platysternon megacephalum]
MTHSTGHGQNSVINPPHVPRGGWFYPHATDGESDAKRERDSPEVTRLDLAASLVVTIDREPAITSLALEGNITSSTFVLEQPRCVFNETVSDTDEIWLVVSLSSGRCHSCARDALGSAEGSVIAGRGY